VLRKEDSHAEINLDAYEDEKEKKVTGNTLQIFRERKGRSCMLERSWGEELHDGDDVEDGAGARDEVWGVLVEKTVRKNGKKMAIRRRNAEENLKTQDTEAGSVHEVSSCILHSTPRRH
jgi:hypothetical protein